MAPYARPEVLDTVRRRLQELGLDAYLAYTPSNVFYVTGFQSYFLTQWWRMHGTVLALVPADPAVAPALMVSDFEAQQARRVSGFEDVRPFRLWVELRDAATLQGEGGEEPPRPAQYDAEEQDAIVHAMLADRGLLDGRIGTDLRYVLQDTVARVGSVAPRLRWVDVTEDLYELRSVKHDFEVESLRRATELAEAGMTFAVAGCRPGMTALQMRHRFALGVLQEAMSADRYAGYTDQWVLPAVGAGVQIGVDSESAAGLAPGDLVKFDCGTTVGGYRSDSGRTFAYREVMPPAQHLYEVLLGAHEQARARVRPGTPVREVFLAAQRHIHEHGYPRFTRGHYGHSVGIDTFHEEPPYISATEERPLREGMILAVETPAYSADVGAVMIEDLVLVTPTGHEVLNRLPHHLTVVG